MHFNAHIFITEGLCFTHREKFMKLISVVGIPQVSRRCLVIFLVDIKALIPTRIPTRIKSMSLIFEMQKQIIVISKI